MKRELLNFVNDDKDESRFRLNAISYLEHYTKNAFGKKLIGLQSNLTKSLGVTAQ